MRLCRVHAGIVAVACVVAQAGGWAFGSNANAQVAPSGQALQLARPAPAALTWGATVVPATDSQRSYLAGPSVAPPPSPAVEPAWEIDPASLKGETGSPWREVWAGGEIIGEHWSLYTGFGAALFGHLAQDGWRIRSVAGYGRYRYDGWLTSGGKAVATRFYGTKAFADLLLGYQKQLGPLTLKGFAGVAMLGDHVQPFDPAYGNGELQYGLKIAADAWLNFGPTAWASLGGTWASLDDSYGARARLGYRVMPKLSLGLEGGLVGDNSTDAGRAGMFARYAWDRGEVSVSAGYTGDRDGADAPYASINWLMRF